MQAVERPKLNVVSISGGKDSTATALVCRALEDEQSIIYAFAETDNEHPITYDYLAYLEDRFGAPIKRLRADFSARMERKRRYVSEVWPTEGVPQQIIDRALAALVPTGIAMLDLCIWKGRFPSRKAQFCTDELKAVPLLDFQMSLVEQGYCVWSWQGVRADESAARRYRQQFVELDDNLFVYYPILRWTAESCFEAMEYCGIKPNPLYLQGMKRVGCMPCINCGKDELREIAKRWPEVVERISEWERCVAAASKRGLSSFFAAPTKNNKARLQGTNIHERVEWAGTARGGRQLDIFAELPPPRCHSFYQLCE